MNIQLVLLISASLKVYARILYTGFHKERPFSCLFVCNDNIFKFKFNSSGMKTMSSSSMDLQRHEIQIRSRCSEE